MSFHRRLLTQYIQPELFKKNPTLSVKIIFDIGLKTKIIVRFIFHSFELFSSFILDIKFWFFSIFFAFPISFKTHFHLLVFTLSPDFFIIIIITVTFFILVSDILIFYYYLSVVIISSSESFNFWSSLSLLDDLFKNSFYFHCFFFSFYLRSSFLSSPCRSFHLVTFPRRLLFSMFLQILLLRFLFPSCLIVTWSAFFSAFFRIISLFTFLFLSVSLSFSFPFPLFFYFVLSFHSPILRLLHVAFSFLLLNHFLLQFGILSFCTLFLSAIVSSSFNHLLFFSSILELVFLPSYFI